MAYFFVKTQNGVEIINSSNIVKLSVLPIVEGQEEDALIDTITLNGGEVLELAADKLKASALDSIFMRDYSDMMEDIEGKANE